MGQVISLYTRRPLASLRVVPIGEHRRIPGDRDVAHQRGRLVGRWCSHLTIAKRQGFIDEVARDGDTVLAKMSRTDGGSDWYAAALIVPASMGRAR